jgi:hypothetical protein
MTTAPMNPLAGPSGPGKYSTRTDKLEMGSTSYGEGKETAEIKSGAMLASTPDVRPTPAAEVRNAAMAEEVVPLFAPSQRPDEPITAGIAMGDGVGPEGLMMAKQTMKTSDTLVKMLPFDTTGEIGILYQQALARGD